MTTDQHLAWCATWNRAILSGSRPIDALAQANAAAKALEKQQ